MQTWDAEGYVKHSSHQEKLGEEILSHLVLRGDERILDIGCGDGRLAARIAALHPGCSVVGVDYSPDMIDHACSHHEAPNLAFMVMDAQALRFQEEFDRIISISCLHWVGDHTDLLGRIREALRIGGRTFLQFGGLDEASRFNATMTSFVRDPRWLSCRDESVPVLHFFSAAQYADFVARAGLKPLRVELVHKEIVYGNREKLTAMVESVLGVCLARMSSDARRSIIDDIVEEYLGDSYPAGQPIRVSLPRLEVEVERV